MANTKLVLAALLLLLLVGCAKDPVSEKQDDRRIEVYVDEEPNNPDNLNRIHVADIRIELPGTLNMTIIKGSGEITGLKAALADIESKAHRTMITYEDIETIDGQPALVMKARPVTSNEPEYIYGVADLLPSYGFIGEVKDA